MDVNQAIGNTILWIFSWLVDFFYHLDWSVNFNDLVYVSVDNSILEDFNRPVDDYILGHLFFNRHFHNLFDRDISNI